MGDRENYAQFGSVHEAVPRVGLQLLSCLYLTCFMGIGPRQLLPIACPQVGRDNVTEVWNPVLKKTAKQVCLITI